MAPARKRARKEDARPGLQQGFLTDHFDSNAVVGNDGEVSDAGDNDAESGNDNVKKARRLPISFGTAPDKKSDDPEVPEGHKYVFGGVELQFPFKAYPSQIQMMSKIISAIQKSQNAVLESPTGSGKSLSLLCGVLAWRQNEKQRIRELQNQKAAKCSGKENNFPLGGADEADHAPTKVGEESYPLTPLQNTHMPADIPADETPRTPPRAPLIIINDDDDFQPANPATPVIAKSSASKRRKRDVQLKEEASDTKPLKPEPSALVNGNNSKGTDSIRERIPKIYYGTRTHKQISQVVAELKVKTIYRPKMAILGSRNHLCIHPQVTKSANRNEECSTLLDSNACHYHHGMRNLTGHRALQTGGSMEIWDIEDLVKLGKRQRGCPYFSSRLLADNADIVFCPYNYLIDPIIREAMDIDLTNNIVILDEAHNIEDAAREAGSIELEEPDLQEITRHLRILSLNASTDLRAQYALLHHVADSLHTWMVKPDHSFSIREYEKAINLWTGEQIIEILDSFGINSDTLFSKFKPALADVAKAISEEKAYNGGVKTDMLSVSQFTASQATASQMPYIVNSLNIGSLRTLEGIITVFGYLLERGKNYAADYKLALIKEIRRFDDRHYSKGESDWILKLGFWCLNPGVTFDAMSQKTRSIILTSGTLSPLVSFASELQAPFPVRLEAGHVIGREQVWAGVLPVGPKGVELNAVYGRMESLEFQDDMGDALHQIVLTIPMGILCFVPSYSALDKFIHRWKATGIYQKMEKRKLIVTEPQSSQKTDIERVMKKFYNAIAKAQEGNGPKDGALFIAVYRGKVSEGIDFSDDNCRAVAAIGIPYPHLKDVQVKLKREYNDAKARAGKDVLNGGVWYDIQAYRAINQALGRCIRHRHDWGAIIILEHRFLQQRNVNGLSKWIRERIVPHRSFNDAIASLEKFLSLRQAQLQATEQVEPAISSKLDVDQQDMSTSAAPSPPQERKEIVVLPVLPQKFSATISEPSEIAHIKTEVEASPEDAAKIDSQVIARYSADAEVFDTVTPADSKPVQTTFSSLRPHGHISRASTPSLPLPNTSISSNTDKQSIFMPPIINRPGAKPAENDAPQVTKQDTKSGCVTSALPRSTSNLDMEWLDNILDHFGNDSISASPTGSQEPSRPAPVPNLQYGNLRASSAIIAKRLARLTSAQSAPKVFAPTSAIPPSPVQTHGLWIRCAMGGSIARFTVGDHSTFRPLDVSATPFRSIHESTKLTSVKGSQVYWFQRNTNDRSLQVGIAAIREVNRSNLENFAPLHDNPITFSQSDQLCYRDVVCCYCSVNPKACHIVGYEVIAAARADLIQYVGDIILFDVAVRIERERMQI